MAENTRAAALHDYLRNLGDGRQLSTHTVAAYRRDLEELCAYLDSTMSTPEWSWSDIDRLVLRGYMGHLARRGLSRRSIARKLSAIRSFYRYLQREDVIDANPAKAVRSPKLEKHLPSWLTPSETE